MYGDIHIDVSNQSIDLGRKEEFTDMEKIEDEEDLEAHVDNQPGQQQHPLVICNSSTGQTENF